MKQPFLRLIAEIGAIGVNLLLIWGISAIFKADFFNIAAIYAVVMATTIKIERSIQMTGSSTT